VEHRYQLHRLEGKPKGYVMGRTEAEAIRDRVCSEIRYGTFRHPKLGPAPIAPVPVDQRLTLNDVIKEYTKRHVWAAGRRPRSGQIMIYNVRVAQETVIPAGSGQTIAVGQRVMAEITKADIEAMREPLRTRRPGVKGGEVGANRILRRLRHVFNWAIVEGYVDHTPFKRHGLPVIKMNGAAETPRHRRLEGDEEERLLLNASPWLRDLIVAALETGCRRGELLSLQWHQVRWAENTLLLSADKTKTGEARAVPITSRLHGVLERRQWIADGEPFKPNDYVFGNEVGEQRLWIHHDWKAACDAAGIEGLHFHDLRREFASRLLETPGVSLHDVSDWVGHSNVVTTSRYLATSGVRKQRVLERFEAGRRAAAQGEVAGA
jgi:integrase